MELAWVFAQYPADLFNTVGRKPSEAKRTLRLPIKLHRCADHTSFQISRVVPIEEICLN